MSTNTTIADLYVIRDGKWTPTPTIPFGEWVRAEGYVSDKDER